MGRRFFVFALAAVLMTACSHSDTTSATASSSTAAPDASATTDPFGTITPGPDEGASAGPAAAPSDAAAAGTAAAGTATAAPAVVVAATPAQPAGSLKHVALTDISGTAGESEIENLAALGAIEPASGAFGPHDPLTRATFVRWLVKANNAENSDAGAQIRPAETTDDRTFVDVPTASADYKYIQGMADAGFVIGIDAKHFAPNRNITREEMIAIYMNRVAGAATLKPTAVDDIGYSYTDIAEISKPYRGAFAQDKYVAFFSGNVPRAFGTVRELHPQRAATREEAALLLSHIQYGDAAKAVTAAQAPAQ